MNYLGEKQSMMLPHLHALTGCDSTSYFYEVGKVKVLRKCLKDPDVLDLLELLGKEVQFSNVEEERVSKFVQQVCYNGYKNETMIDTKIRLYQNMKTKSSLPLPPDTNSLRQALLRVHHQVYYWIRFNHHIVTELDLSKYGWNVDADDKLVTPVWYEGPQLPESMTRQKQKDAVLIDEPKTKRSRVEINNEEVLLHNSNETSSDLENELECIYFGESSDDDDSSDSDYSDYVGF